MRRARSDRGVALLTVIVITVIVGGISSAFFILSLNEAQSSEKMRYKLRATYLAEAGAEIAANTLRQAIANAPNIMSDPAVGGTPYNTLAVDQVINIEGWPVQCKAMKRQLLPYTPPPGVNPASALHKTEAAFEIMGYASVGGNPNKPKDRMAQSATVYKLVEVLGTPLFQFLAFYQGDMEVNPGPYAHFHGRMHTNGDMYLTDRDTGRGMVIDSDHVQAHGSFYRSYSSSIAGQGTAATAVETGADGPVWVRKTGTTPIADASIDAAPSNDAGLVQWGLGLQSTPPPAANTFATTAQANWNGTVLDGSMGAQTMAAPAIQSVQPGGYYQNQAAAAGNNNVQIVDGVFYYNGAVVNSLPTGIMTTSSIYDARQGTSVPVTTINVGALMQSQYAPKGGIIYATSSTASASNPQGLQLTNGSYIGAPAGMGTNATYGLTVTSNLPVYVQGDYNGSTSSSTTVGVPPSSGTGAATQVANTTGLGADTMRQDPNTGAWLKYSQTIAQWSGGSTIDPVTGASVPITAGMQVDTVPSAIIADAVTLLSNSWNNSRNASNGMTGASNTTFNAAMIAGNQLTKDNSSLPDNGYNGGLQNLPRFLENWGGINCNIAGSFANLWQSQIATGLYGKGNVYVPPNRFWDFDNHFNSLGGTPPGAPAAVTIGRTTYEEGAVRGQTNGTGGFYDLVPQ